MEPTESSTNKLETSEPTPAPMHETLTGVPTQSPTTYETFEPSLPSIDQTKEPSSSPT